jgi:probable HAF family extracellular repeat protein
LALGVNANGRVVGLEVDRRGHEQAFVWEASSRVFNLLGTFGGVGSRANDVNEAGTVTGCADVSSGTARAFRWTPSSGLTLADTYSGSTYSCGRGINRQEDVAGLFVGAGATGTDTAAVFDASGIPLLAARAGGPALYWSVNDNGLAVGSADASGLRQAIVYQPGVGINVLPPLTSGGGAEARDINGCGRIVGSGYAGSGPYRALMWVPVKC